MENKHVCKKCQRELPEDSKKDLCEHCQNKRVSMFQKTGTFIAGLLGIVATVFIYNSKE